MKKIIVFSFAVVAFTLSACHKKQLADSSKTTTPTKTESVKTVIINPSIDVASIGTVVTGIDSLQINGDVLSIYVNYGGGCKEHSFDLYSNDMYEKSLPPQLTLYIKHTNNGDACRELVMRELKFNIGPVKKKYSSLTIKVGEQTIKYNN